MNSLPGAPMSTASTLPPPAKRTSEDHEILFQDWFKSVGPRTYAAQVKKANNGNHYLILTEGRREEKTGEIRKNRLFLYSEDFIAFFKMLHETAVFVREHPVSPEVKKRQERRWAKERQPDEKSSQKTEPNRPAPRRQSVPASQVK